MITYFYKILYKNKDVVYVGVTTRKINQRFKEHIKTKNLNKNYSIIEFDKIIHPVIDSIEVFNEEKIKVFNLERKYIQEEKDKGSTLLNISKGGEWGADILNNLRKKHFLEKYGSYDGYKKYHIKIEKTKKWLRDWIRHKSENKTKVWLRNWIVNYSENKTKAWLRSWIDLRSKNKTKAWLRNWIICRK